MEPLGKRYRSLRETVAEEIRARILEGTYAPGMRLVEEELARQLDVSRMPVREALTTLETEGFVEVVPRRGASVAALSPKEAVELFEVRSTLEGLAARLAARRSDPASLEELQAIVDEGTEVVAKGRREAIPALHQRFHVALARAAGNQYLMDLVSPLPGKIEWIYNTVLRSRAPVSWPEHVKILEVVRSGDEDHAEKTTRRHVDDSAHEFLTMLDRAASDGHADDHG